MVKFHAQDPSRNTLKSSCVKIQTGLTAGSVHRIRSHKAVSLFFLFSHIFCKNHFLLLLLPVVNHSDTSFCHFPKACSSKRLPSLLLIHASGLMLSALWWFFLASNHCSTFHPPTQNEYTPEGAFNSVSG